jgi:Asp-tRNA(Asn)/Glu-tRNA(Gln) amidotransferase A subunit family amidase
VDPNSCRALLEINPDALDIAEASDLERKQDIFRGPLHGIPFRVKDNVGSKDKMQDYSRFHGVLTLTWKRLIL